MEYKFTSPELIKTIKHYMVDNDLNYGAFSKLLGYNASNWSEIMHNKRGISLGLAKKLIKLTGITAEFLLDNTKSK